MNFALRSVVSKSAIRGFSLFLKIGGICLLTLLLHIPLLMTHSILQERQGYQRQATAEIAGTWGRSQSISGPVLAVPYAYKTRVIRPKVVGEKVVQVEEVDLTEAVAYFLPETLAVGGPVEPEVRHRGIYDTVVFSTKLQLAGHFQPDFTVAGIESDRIDWNKAYVLFGVSDLRGLRSVSPFQVTGGKAAAFESADGGAAAFLPLAAKLENALPRENGLDFTFDVSVQGSEQLQIAPVGKVMKATLASPWPNPSFRGAYLPVRRTVGPGGFTAEWETSHFSRGFPQSWTSRAGVQDMAQKINAAAFGVAFAQTLDGYRLAERAQKYGVLFFVLVFAVFFLFEVTAGLRIHPLQYALVGAGLCLFFLGFLALSEFMAIAPAYGAAAGACTALVSLYAWSFLRTGKRTLVILGGLAGTYGYLYFVLQSEDYALLAGTCALFAALGLVMFCTRRMNWYSLDPTRPTKAAGETPQAGLLPGGD